MAVRTDLVGVGSNLSDFNVDLGVQSLNPGNLDGGTGGMSLNVGSIKQPQLLRNKRFTLSDDVLGSFIGRVSNAQWGSNPVQLLAESMLNRLNVEVTIQPSSTIRESGMNTILAQANMVSQGLDNTGTTFPGWRGSLWDYLKHFCAVHNLEMLPHDTNADIVVFRAIRGQTFQPQLSGLSYTVNDQQLAQNIVVETYGYGVVNQPGVINNSTNPRMVSGGGAHHFGARFSWSAAFVTGISDHPLGITTAWSSLRGGSGSVGGGRGVDRYGNADVAPGTSGSWIACPVTASVAYNFSQWVKWTRTPALARVIVRFHDGAGNWVGTTVVALTYTPVAGVWQELPVTVVPPAGATYMVYRLDATTDASWTSTDGVYVTGILDRAIGPYFDGSMLGFKWQTTPDASPSEGTYLEFTPIATENMQILSINAGETISYEVQLNAWVTAVNQPVAVDLVGPEERTDLGAYCVVGADGLPVTAAQWTGQGGKLVVSLTDDPSVIKVEVTAPPIDILLGTDGGNRLSPYSIAAASGDNTLYNSLHITGVGLRFNKQELTLPTGVNSNVTIEEIGVTVDNPWVSNIEKAYDIGVRAAQAWAGPTYTFSEGTTSKRHALRNVVGSRFNGDNVKFRIESASGSSAGVRCAGISDTTFEDFNTSATGLTFTAWAAATTGLSFDQWATVPLKVS